MTKRHDICAWTSGSGEAGFRPAIRKKWASISTAEKIDMAGAEIKPRLPSGIELGFEAHYPKEVDEKNVDAVADALDRNGMFLGMITPGLHSFFAYGGPASLDDNERADANKMCRRTVDLAYSPELKKRWHPQAPPTGVLWNGSWAYEITGPWILKMLGNLDGSVTDLILYEQDEKGGELYWGVEPKRDEGHPKHLVPHSASGLAMVERLAKRGVDVSKVGLNMEFGHEEILNLDVANSIAEQIMAKAVKHVHVNSQGRDGINEGGPGQYDVDYGVAITWPNISVARMLQDTGYNRWIGHDMQPRGHDNEKQALNRIVRSILSWEAMEKVAKELPMDEFYASLTRRDTAPVYDLAGDAITTARGIFKKLYKGSMRE